MSSSNLINARRDWLHIVRVTCFGSGSNGNSLLVQSGTTAILIDAGVPIRTLRASLRQTGVSDGGLNAVLISHEHSDHIRSATQVAKYHRVPYFGTIGTRRAIERSVHGEWQPMTGGVGFSIGSLEITPVAVSHDANEPVGFLIAEGETKVAIFTDLGEPSSDVSSAIRGASLVVLESNYDETMLRNGPYPTHLKRRIRGPLGHLANDICSTLLADNVDDHTGDIWLAHLSEKNNLPRIAHATAEASLRSSLKRIRISTLPRYGATLSWDSDEAASRPRQQSLFGDALESVKQLTGLFGHEDSD